MYVNLCIHIFIYTLYVLYPHLKSTKSLNGDFVVNFSLGYKNNIK